MDLILILPVHDTALTCNTRFYYDEMKRKIGYNIQLILNDSDSLIYQDCTDDFYQDMCAM